MTKHTSKNMHRLQSRGFTLIELLVAILVLIVVILATSRIFGTASEVTGLGRATAAVMQEAAALERRMREDIAKLSHEGFFAIRQVEVRNDIHVANGGALLNPYLPDDEVIRADQLVFLTNNVQSSGILGTGGRDLIRGQSPVSRVYYGHGAQLLNAAPFEFQDVHLGFAHDPGPVGPNSLSSFDYLFDLRPWRGPMEVDPDSAISMVRTRIASMLQGNVFQRTGDGAIDAGQPDALNWLLCRQAVLLADDDQNSNAASDQKTVYLDDIRTARSIFIDHPGYGAGTQSSREIRNARVDAAAILPPAIRNYVEWSPANVERPWNQPSFGGGVNADQRSIIASAIYYPRAERKGPSSRRADQALTSHVIGSAVSSFKIEWTWAEGAGEVRNSNGRLVPNPDGTTEGLNDFYYGFRPNCWNEETGTWCLGFEGFEQPEQPWFGLNHPLRDRGVGFMGFEDAAINDPHIGSNLHYYQRANFDTPIAVSIASGMNNAENNIERYFGPGSTAPINPYGTGDDVRIYEALFGYNRDQPLNQFNEAEFELGYTPWPSAIRVTVVFHDPGGRLEYGREYQFVIDLPRRAK